MSSLIPGFCFIQEAHTPVLWVCIRWIGRSGTYAGYYSTSMLNRIGWK
jgi:hypothetical protein